jgi:hypothetical protein
MVWLYQSPIPVGRRGFLPAVTGFEGGGGSAPCHLPYFPAGFWRHCLSALSTPTMSLRRHLLSAIPWHCLLPIFSQAHFWRCPPPPPPLRDRVFLEEIPQISLSFKSQHEGTTFSINSLTMQRLYVHCIHIQCGICTKILLKVCN